LIPRISGTWLKKPKGNKELINVGSATRSAYNIEKSGRHPVSMLKTAGTFLFNPARPGPAETLFVKCFYSRAVGPEILYSSAKSCKKQLANARRHESLYLLKPLSGQNYFGLQQEEKN